MIFALLSVVVITSVAGELMVTQAMKTIGEIHDFRPKPFIHALGRAFATGWLPGGIGLLAISFFSLMAALSAKDVSFVIPATAVTYVLNTLGAAIFLREHVNGRRWLGAALVSVGVALISM